MKSISIGVRAFAFGIAGILLLASGASAAEVRVMISGGLAAAYKSGMEPIAVASTVGAK